jgi:hypothetical protein
MHQLPDSNATEMNTQEHSRASTAEQAGQHKKRPLLSADAEEHPPAAKRPKASGKKVQTKLTNKTDTTVCVLCTTLFYK